MHYLGGGVRGAAHIGVIRALEENGIKITALSGTSAGSIVAALYGMGYKEDEIIKLFRYFSKSVMGISPKYLFTGIREKRGIKLGRLNFELQSRKCNTRSRKTKRYKKFRRYKYSNCNTNNRLNNRQRNGFYKL